MYTTLQNATIKYAKYCIPKKSTYNLRICYAGSGSPSIEFVTRDIARQDISTGLEKITDILVEVGKLQEFFNVQKIRHIMNDAGNWLFNYLTTTNGKVVGPREAIRKCAKAVEIMLNLSGTQDQSNT